MGTKVDYLPLDAVYDYEDIFGVKHYHTRRYRYTTEWKHRFGKASLKVTRYNNND